MEILWFIPTHGDSRYLGTQTGGRTADHLYFKQVAQAADRLGYTGVLLPTGRSCEDPWLTAAALAGETSDLKFLVAVTSGTDAAVCRRENGVDNGQAVRRPFARKCRSGRRSL